ncbi:MAG: glycosyltransferase family 2 protein [Flavobacteriales bacterium]
MPSALRVCIVVPCYNEEGVLAHTTDVLLAQLASMTANGACTSNSFICCVDDGSRDNTWNEIEALSRKHARIRGIKLSTNFGHQNALVAGLFSMRPEADVLITIDADLQDEVSVIDRMLEHHRQGKRVVYGVRKERGVDPLGKRLAARLFYSFMHRVNDRAIQGHADFRSADARVIADLERFGEANVYLRGIFPMIGYPSAVVEYTRKDRHAGGSKYGYGKLLSLAWQGVTSFTTAPLKMVFYTGIVMAVLALVLAMLALWALLTERTLQGWFSSTLIVLIFSAMNMISLGVIGEYVGKIYKEVKHRPRYIVERTTGDP